MKKIILLTFILCSSIFLQAQEEKSLKFDGINDYVAVSNTSLSSIGSGDFTFEATINGKSDEQNTHTVIFSNRKQSTNGVMFFLHGVWGGSNYKMLSVQLGGVNYLIINNGTFNADILDGTCHHIAITKKEKLLSFYVDGNEIGTKTIGGLRNPSVQSSATNIWIGQDQVSNNTFNGIISQVKIWNVAKESASIKNDINFDIINDNLIGSWSLNDGSGQIVIDNSDNGIHGELGSSSSDDDNDPTWTSDANCNKIRNIIQDGGLKFDGKNDYVAISNTSLNSIENGDFTFEATINGKSDEQNTHAIIFSNRKQSTNGVMFFLHGVWGGSNYKMLSIQLGGVNYLIINNGTFNADILDGTCHHVAITKKEKLLSFYVDGNEIGTKTIGEFSNPTVLSPATNMWIGQDQPSNNTFNGTISQVKVWNLAKESNNIKNDIGFDVINDNLIGSWNLNDGLGQTAIDNSINSLHGELGSSSSDDDNDPTWTSVNCDVISSIVTQNIKSQNVQIYPNPVKNRLYMKLKNDEVEATITLLSINGHTILTEQVNHNTSNFIDLSNIQSGLYIIHIQVDGTQRFEKVRIID